LGRSDPTAVKRAVEHGDLFLAEGDGTRARGIRSWASTSSSTFTTSRTAFKSLFAHDVPSEGIWQAINLLGTFPSYAALLSRTS
jgi:hypothetical protein